MKCLIGAAIAAILLLSSAEAVIGPDHMALADWQRAEGNFTKSLGNASGYADLLNTTNPDMIVGISPGEYESTRYDIPVGPFEISFERRSPLDVFGVKYITFNESLGSGKSYHSNEYERYTLVALQHNPDNGLEVGTIYFLITRQLSKTHPERPQSADFYWGSPSMWYSNSPVSTTIDGYRGYLTSYEYNNNYYIHPSLRDTQYIWRYDINPNIFVTIMQQKGDFSRDMLLVIDTLNIRKRSDR